MPVANIAELLALARRKPGEITYGTAAVGSAPHVNIVKFDNMAQVKLQPIHYRGAAPALNDVMAGTIKLMCVSTSLVAQPYRDHRLKMLAVGAQHRVGELPEIPTVAESGVPGYEAATWFGLATTGGTPPAIVAKINADVQKVLNDPAFRARFMAPQMFESMASSPEQFGELISHRDGEATGEDHPRAAPDDGLAIGVIASSSGLAFGNLKDELCEQSRMRRCMSK